MKYFRAASKLSKEQIMDLLKSNDLLLLNPKKINSTDELLLAEKLATDAFKEKRSIAKNFDNEFLLWLAANTNISSALAKYSFQSPRDILVVSFSQKDPTKAFQLEVKPLKLRKKATSLEIERISLARLF